VILTAHATKVNKSEPNWTEPQTRLASQNRALNFIIIHFGGKKVESRQFTVNSLIFFGCDSDMNTNVGFFQRALMRFWSIEVTKLRCPPSSVLSRCAWRGNEFVAGRLTRGARGAVGG